MPLAMLAYLVLAVPATATVTLHSAATMAVVPETCSNLPPAVSTFSTTAQAVYLVFVVSGHKAGDVASVEYISPSGALYAAASGGWSPITAQEEAAARFCFYDDMFRVAGAAPASTPGQWTIRILYNRVLLTTLTFTITMGGGSGSCTYSLAPPVATIPAAGGVAAVSLATATGCQWNAQVSATWITLMTGTSGTGPAVIGYQVQANSSTAQRSGTITVNGQTHTINQAAGSTGSCTYTLSVGAAQIAASGGTGAFTVTTGATCQWNAAATVTWISATPASGTGTATISYQVQANTTGAQRSGAITVNGQTHTVTQEGVGGGTPPPSLCVTMFEPAAATAAAGAVSGAVELRTAAGCQWSLRSTATWLRVSPAAGTGEARLQWSTTANTSLETRSATISAGETGFGVTQSVAAPAGAPSITSVVNDADLTTAIAPGMRVLVRGALLAAGEAAIEKPPCMAAMGGVSVEASAGSVTMGAALFSIAPGQLGVQLPYALPVGDVDLRVRHGGGTSPAYRIKVTAAAPRIYRALHEDGTAVTGEKPSAGGAVVDVLMTGLGAVTPALEPDGLPGDGGALGPAQRTTAAVSATIGGRTAEVLYAGLATALAGVYRVRLRIPQGVETGDGALVVAGGEAESPPVPLAVVGKWVEAGAGTIGAAGGEVQAGGVRLTAAAGALPEGTVLRVRRAEGASEAMIDGIPAERRGELTLSLEMSSAPDGETLIAIREEGFSGPTFLRAVVENGRATVKVPASYLPPADAKASERQAPYTNRPLINAAGFSWMVWAAGGWDYRTSPKGLFTIFFDRARRAELTPKADVILDGLDRAHELLGQKLRLSWEARQRWPIELTMYPFEGEDRDKWGSEGRVNFGKEGQTICLNTNFMNTDKQMRLMVGTAAHELFHVLQNLYDSRFGMAIASQGASAPWVWLEEAASTWFERLVVSDAETYVPTTLSPDVRGAGTGSSDNFAFLKEGLGRTRSQEHGYGSSMFLQYVQDELGAEAIGTAMKQIARGTPTSNFVDPLNALEDAVGGITIIKHWMTFCERYFAGTIYGKQLQFPTPELFAGMAGRRHIFTGPADRGEDLSWSAPALSGNVVLLNFTNANFAADTPLRIWFHDASHFPAGAHLYRLRHMPDGTSTWTKAAEPATYFELLNAEKFGQDNENLLLMAVNPWKDTGKHKVSVRAGQPKFKNAIIKLLGGVGGASLRTETLKNGSWNNPQVTVSGNVVTMTNHTTSMNGAVSYSMRAKFTIKGALIEKLEYSYRDARADDVYEFEVELRNLPRTEVVNSFDGTDDVRWFVFEAGTPASKTGVADKVVRFYGMRTLKGKQYPQEWSNRQTIEVRLIAPDPE